MAYTTLFIKKIENAEFILDEVNARLVVMEVDEWPCYLLAHVFLLLQFKHMLHHTQHATTNKPRLLSCLLGNIKPTHFLFACRL